ncbi:MAG: Uma2 family endonuclease [Ferruginibacter sp.]|nr:Uma2 family endonuclease [Ferruginibacter sp.]
MDQLVSKGDKKYSFAEYMAMEDTSVEKHDFYHGEIFAMAGATAKHHQIAQNINAALITRFKPDGCFISLEGMRLELVEENFYLYPDVFLTCDERDKKNDLFKKFPSIIFEVISDSTALYDKEVKLKYYKRIESLRYYVLVSQKEVMVEVYARIDNSQIWKYQTFEALSEIIEFDRLGFSLPLTVIYDTISFEKVEESK